MNLQGAITILFNHGGLTIEIHDELSSNTFVKATLDAKETCQALSRLTYTSCKLDIRGLDKVGKTMEVKRLEFEFPDCGCSERESLAIDLAQKNCPAGWEPDLRFRLQNSFFKRDGKQYAQTTIRRWAEPDNAIEQREKTR